MPKLTLGIDVIEIERIRSAVSRRPRVLGRLFTSEELDLADGRADPIPFYAGRFAAKEAVGKALGRPLPWHDVAILQDTTGRPMVKLRGAARTVLGTGSVQVSISHSKGVGAAVALAEWFPPE